jgi:hypothetical protein
MSRFLCLIIISFSSNLFAQTIDNKKFSEREQRIVELSGLLSLSDQVKTSAQYIIAQTAEKAVASAKGKLVTINHAQHFGIAQSLAKRWSQAEWKQRLLVIVDSIDKKSQKIIEKELSQKILQSAQKKERAGISNQHKAEYSLYMNKLKQKSPVASRWNLIKALDNKSSFSQLIIHTREQVYIEIASHVKGWQPPANWQKEAKQEVQEFLFYAYRKTPNAELKKIANGYDSPALKSFLAKVNAGL